MSVFKPAKNIGSNLERFDDGDFFEEYQIHVETVPCIVAHLFVFPAPRRRAAPVTLIQARKKLKSVFETIGYPWLYSSTEFFHFGGFDSPQFAA